jgi:hypothetical protein
MRFEEKDLLSYVCGYTRNQESVETYQSYRGKQCSKSKVASSFVYSMYVDQSMMQLQPRRRSFWLCVAYRVSFVVVISRDFLALSCDLCREKWDWLCGRERIARGPTNHNHRHLFRSVVLDRRAIQSTFQLYRPQESLIS